MNKTNPASLVSLQLETFAKNAGGPERGEQRKIRREPRPLLRLLALGLVLGLLGTIGLAAFR